MMDEFVVHALSGLGTAAISAAVSWRVSKTAAQAEIDKLRETWAHEKEQAFEQAFSEMVSAVSYYCAKPTPGPHKDAVEKAGAVRPLCVGAFGERVDSLCDALRSGRDAHAVQAALCAVIEHKRTGGGEQGGGNNADQRPKKGLRNLAVNLIRGNKLDA